MSVHKLALIRLRNEGRAIGLALFAFTLFVPVARAAASDPLVNPAHLLVPDAPEWSDLTAGFQHHPDTTAEFTERRYFPFKKVPVELKGEVRISATRGLSLHYTAPDEITVILDPKGMLNRVNAKDTVPPTTPGSSVETTALLNILHLDLVVLAKDFKLYGQRNAKVWTLVLMPDTPQLRAGLEQITVAGESDTIRRLEIRHTATSAIVIIIAPPRLAASFTAEEIKTYFR